MSKRFLSSGMLVLALLASSWGNMLAAAFCPHGVGRECCFAKSYKRSSPSTHESMAGFDMHMDGMSMDGMKMDDMAMGDTSIDHMALNDTMIDLPTVDMSARFSPPALSEQPIANKVDQPVKSCAHCLGHSGILNAPLSFLSVSDPSGKEIGSVLLPVSRFLIRPATAPAEIGLPREHAPPGTSAPRYILISVFKI